MTPTSRATRRSTTSWPGSRAGPPRRSPPRRRPATATTGRAHGDDTHARPGGPNGRPPRPATPSQVRAIVTIARRQRADLAGLLRDDYGVDRPEDLSISQASALIDALKLAGQTCESPRRSSRRPRRRPITPGASPCRSPHTPTRRRHRRRPGRRPPDRLSGRYSDPGPGGFTGHGFGAFYRVLMPSLRGPEKRAFFNRVSGGVVLGFAMGGAAARLLLAGSARGVARPGPGARRRVLVRRDGEVLSRLSGRRRVTRAAPRGRPTPIPFSYGKDRRHDAVGGMRGIVPPTHATEATVHGSRVRPSAEGHTDHAAPTQGSPGTPPLIYYAGNAEQGSSPQRNAILNDLNMPFQEKPARASQVPDFANPASETQ